jgi:hypothetical protein
MACHVVTHVRDDEKPGRYARYESGRIMQSPSDLGVLLIKYAKKLIGRMSRPAHVSLGAHPAMPAVREPREGDCGDMLGTERPVFRREEIPSGLETGCDRQNERVRNEILRLPESARVEPT